MKIIGYISATIFLLVYSGREKIESKYYEILMEWGVNATLKPVFALLFGAVVKLWL